MCLYTHAVIILEMSSLRKSKLKKGDKKESLAANQQKRMTYFTLKTLILNILHSSSPMRS